MFGQKPQLLRNFQQRLLDGAQDEFGELQNGIHPETLLVERVIAQKGTVKGTQYLTKWCGLPYSESTWESPADLQDDKVHRPWEPQVLICLLHLLTTMLLSSRSEQVCLESSDLLHTHLGLAEKYCLLLLLLLL